MRMTKAALAILAAALGAGCAKDTTTGASGEAVPAAARPGAGAGIVSGAVTSPTAAPAATAKPAESVVYFDLDSSVLDGGDTELVRRWSAFLIAHGAPRITLTGHCDERGTREYNAALGERRARAVRDRLVAFGVDAQGITVLSAGEEQPVAQGHDEAAWRQNRRVEFLQQ
jgi:peptidoglycan-associated lipoprotein